MESRALRQPTEEALFETSVPRGSNRGLRVLVWGIVALFSLVATLYAAHARFIARDEGFYLMAARLVMEGQVPYRDFFYPQMPLVPYVFGLWHLVAGESWRAARTGAALLAFAAYALTALYTARRSGFAAGVLTFLLCGLAIILQAWIPTAQTDSVSAPLMMAAACALQRAAPAWAGLFAGLTVLSRLTLAPVVPIFFLWGVATSGAATRGRAALSFLQGLLVPVLIGVAFLAFDPENFYHNNLGYHLQRSTLTDEEGSFKRLLVLRILLGLRDGSGIGEWQFRFILYSALLHSALRVRRGGLKAVDPLVWLGAVLFVIHLTPKPTYLQYFCIVALPLFPAAAALWCGAFRLLAMRANVRWLQPVGIALLVMWFGWAGSLDVERFTRTGHRVIGIGQSYKATWKLDFIKRVNEAITKLSTDGLPVFAWWPGHLYGTEIAPLPGTENHFGPHWVMARQFPPEEQLRRKAISYALVADAFREGRTRFAILYSPGKRPTDLETRIREAGGVVVFSELGIKIYERREKGSEPPSVDSKPIDTPEQKPRRKAAS